MDVADPDSGSDSSREEGFEEQPAGSDSSAADFESFERQIRTIFRAAAIERAESGPGEGAILGDFRIVRKIGSGGMATVYEAIELPLRRRVALKILPIADAVFSMAVAAFRREALALARQHHRGIVQVYRVGEANGVHFIAQELIGDGETLADEILRLRAAGSLPGGHPRQVAHWIADVADAVGHAHSKSVIHRDLKPSNILLAGENRVLVSDFGLASLGAEFASAEHGFVGTPFYVAPEQAAGGAAVLDARSDVFSLGVMMYECLSLERPFTGDSTQDVLQNIRTCTPEDVRRHGRRIPEDLALVCHRALAKLPRDRYQSMAEFAADLRRWLEGEAVFAGQRRGARRVRAFAWRHRLVLSAVLCGLLLAALSVWHVVSQARAAHRDALAHFEPLALVFVDSAPRFRFARPSVHCRDSAPWRPEWRVIAGIEDLLGDELVPAAANFREFLGGPHPALRALDADVSLCLAVCAHALAEDPRHGASEETLRAEARAAFELIDPQAMRPQTALFLHERGIIPSPQDLRARRDHWLTELYIGLEAFQRLHLGGRTVDFERATRALRNVLGAWPDHPVALACLARILLFQARAFDWRERLEEAERLGRRALEVSEAAPHHRVHTTLGQIALLRGELDAARRCFESAVAADASRGPNHDAYSGLAAVALASGRLDAAGAALSKHPLQASDPRSQILDAELALRLGDLDAAIAHATRAVYRAGRELNRGQETFVAAAYLMLARVQVARGARAAALDTLEQMHDISVYSPRALALGALLIATWSGPGDARMSNVAAALARFANAESTTARYRSPLALAASGAARAVAGDHVAAIDAFQQAIELRTKAWPGTCIAARDAENSRDYDALAVSFHESGDAAAAQSAFDAADRLRSGRRPRDGIAAAMRRRAARLLGRD